MKKKKNNKSLYFKHEILSSEIHDPINNKIFIVNVLMIKCLGVAIIKTKSKGSSLEFVFR